MEKRLLLAVVLMTAAIMFTNLLFPPAEVPEEPENVEEATTSEQVVTAPSAPAVSLPTTPSSGSADSVVVTSPLYRYVFSTRGARLVRAVLTEYPSYRLEGESVQLVPRETEDFLVYQIMVGQEIVPLSELVFEPSATNLRLDGSPESLEFRYADPAGFAVALTYSFDPDGYLIQAAGRVDGLGGQQADLGMRMGPRLELHEARDHQSQREFAVVSRSPGDIDREPFRSVEGEQALPEGLTWAGIKDKYFLATIISREDRPLGATSARRVIDDSMMVGDEEVTLPQVELTTSVPIEADGSFDFGLYLGPQDFERLSAIGSDLEEVTPYGYRWLQPIIRPFAAAVLWVLNTLHNSLGIAYGWVLILFGVMMRMVLWPINAKAMRAQMKNMAVQPLMQEIRDKHKNDPQKQQEAMLNLYKEHGFNPFAGCLPMLVPFPVLITLFFVFQNTIVFRGAEFLWLPDLSLHDPLYILPVLLVVSMFSLQWISANISGMEQNPQMKTMMYVMPIMMGVLFFRFPAGLNLYYAVNQIASMPQQIMIARERRKVQEELKASGGPKLSPPKGGGRRKSKAKR